MIKFYPELRRFGMESLDPDTISLLTKRVYDMAGLMPKVSVYINEKVVKINSFMEYVNMYFDTGSEAPRVRDKETDNDRWQVVISLSDGEPRNVSFVNSVCTIKGGTHVNYIADQLVEKIIEKIKKKDKNLSIKPHHIKSHLWIFVNALIENPTFDSQTKETLTLKPAKFGSECILSDKMIK